MAPSSSCAASLKPNVAYRSLNFAASRKKQTTFPSLAYAGIPYQVFGDSSGALAAISAWSLSAIARSGSFIAAIAASTSASPAALSFSARASAFSSRARACIAAFSSAVNPLDFCVALDELIAYLLCRFVSSEMVCTTNDLQLSSNCAKMGRDARRDRGRRVCRPAVLPALAGLAYPDRRGAADDRADAAALRGAQLPAGERGGDPAPGRLGDGDRPEHDGLAGRSARGRGTRQATAACAGSPRARDPAHAKGPAGPGAGPGAGGEGRRRRPAGPVARRARRAGT